MSDVQRFELSNSLFVSRSLDLEFRYPYVHFQSSSLLSVRLHRSVISYVSKFEFPKLEWFDYFATVLFLKLHV